MNGVLLAIGGSVAVSMIVKATVTLALALLAARLARRQRASVRHVMLTSAFAILIALPVVAGSAPSISMAVEADDLAPAPANVMADAAPLAARSAPVESSVATTDAAAAVPIATILMAVWIAGVAAFLLPVAAALRQLHQLRRSGVAWREQQRTVNLLAADLGVRRRVELLRHDAISGPMTTGVLRPTILLPTEASSWTHEDLHRAIVHELEHVRRRDWLLACAARFICAAYWFHPLVWVARRQLELEAERACDDAVLRRAEATEYAEQLVTLAKRISSSSRQPALAMASRFDLATRVGAVLDSRQRRGRAGALWVVTACALSALIAGTMSPLRVIAAPQQQAAPAGGKFEVASIKPCAAGELPPVTPGGGARSGGYGGGRFETSPDTLTVTCMTVEGMVYLAYAAAGKGLLNDPRKPDELRVKGGPEWAHKDRWSIEAKSATPVERRPMLSTLLQSLLEDRFRLQQHRATEAQPMYGLVLAGGGLKIQPMKPGECLKFDPSSPPTARAPDAGQFWCGALTRIGTSARTRVSMGGTSLDDFAHALSGFADRPVIDKTGNTGLFNIEIVFSPMDAPPVENAAEPLVSVLERQLGLKLEPTRGPAEYLVIDRVERPKINEP